MLVLLPPWVTAASLEETRGAGRRASE
ncbi:DEAD/DEAH box helicase domain protein, partial [Toxoplasma gondii p89]